ncbi:hypothetical protein [Streptomyces lomondensis]|uniref:Integral membrane protein n=1 Tax=Streptomyces lomondensis TaxID=68229 RepID=A0ABQ2WXP6_9ACTN|nr:hypothetical protein [Streptomyces lomondensis]MCF0078557.1 hypothetical protein [Streptomyces lomondensis]GGW78366.1 hypothetical protein GCM10010383_02180 [Streptomyces lomondensis]
MAEPRPFRSPVSAVQLSARLLCWSLAAAMISAAADAFLDPRADWWGVVWPLPWWLFGAAALAWTVLRAREKADRPPPHGIARSDWEQAA